MKIIEVIILVLPVMAAPAEPVHTPNPHIEPMWPKCIKFYQAVPSDTCQTLADKNQIDLAELISLNRGVGGLSGCYRGNVMAGYWYCVKPDGWK
ncbi:putative Class V chitinase [Colletotrichum higginsianum IMI 349063]|nr:putative Class V chitinase [Colletotrichum higginsianum IMI 349063]OBR02888.1 putative Class V chitinase [Colletotrichum higginsianum IMI 349063]TID07250.1 hypothetical protein CH35J_000573 [Colletotrichum higginsianum]GJD00852.1 putative class V chitinase [Colletotrichum higginsianum]